MRPHAQEAASTSAYVPVAPRVRYLVVRDQDVWFIKFDGEEYGPYNTEREALLFAIDAAEKLGAQGEETQVLLMDTSGIAVPRWTYGVDAYPPVL
jgi:hypothetical protein